MKKSIIAGILILTLVLTAITAFAAGAPATAQIEELEYMGFGIVKAELSCDCDWYASAELRLTDASGSELPFVCLGGDEDDICLRAADIADGGAYTLLFSLNGVEQSVRFDATTGQSCRIYADGSVKIEIDGEACDVCGKPGHDDDFCPSRVTGEVLSGDADALARFFDIDRCERCNGIGHDGKNCPAAQ